MRPTWSRRAVELRAEARSHDPAFRARIVRAIEKAFQQAARAVRNERGVCGKVRSAAGSTTRHSSCRTTTRACWRPRRRSRDIGGKPFRAISNGGLDANWMSARGIPTVTLGCGQENPHTAAERLDLIEFRRACRIALRLATAYD